MIGLGPRSVRTKVLGVPLSTAQKYLLVYAVAGLLSIAALPATIKPKIKLVSDVGFIGLKY
jgi:hypothetical protein